MRTKSAWSAALIRLDMLVMGVVFAGFYALRVWRSRARRPSAREVRYSRLIVPTPVLVIPLGLSCDCSFSPSSCEISPCLVMTGATRFIPEYAALHLLIGGICIQYAHGGFKVVSDIVNYFKTDVAHTHANPIAAMVLAYRYDPRSEASFCPRLRLRFLTICKDLTSNTAHVDRLYVVAHSLGTMIALDALRDNDGVASLQGVEFNLFTMGSPYKNIFKSTARTTTSARCCLTELVS